MNGNVAPLSTLGAPFITSTVGGLALDQSNDRLFVSSPFASEITVFDHASQLGSTPTGSRLISGPSTGLNGPQALALDKNGRLFVGNVNAGITVYANAGGITGDVAPVATIQGSNTQFHVPILLAIDNNPGGADTGDLYVVDSQLGVIGTSGSIVVFTDIGNVNGNVSPFRILTFSTAFGNAFTLDSAR
jgi:hypothetical protein